MEYDEIRYINKIYIWNKIIKLIGIDEASDSVKI